MRRTNAIEIEVVSPTKGLVTRIPSDQPDKTAGRAMTVALNVRFEDGVMMAAPGMEPLLFCPADALATEAPAIFIAESNVVSDLAVVHSNAPILGTGQKLFWLDRRFGGCQGSDSEVDPTTPCSGTARSIVLVNFVTNPPPCFNLKPFQVVDIPAGWEPNCPFTWKLHEQSFNLDILTGVGKVFGDKVQLVNLPPWFCDQFNYPGTMSLTLYQNH